MRIVALLLFTVWILSLWLLMVERRRPAGWAALHPLVFIGGTILFLILGLTGIVFLRLLLPD